MQAEAKLEGTLTKWSRPYGQDPATGVTGYDVVYGIDGREIDLDALVGKYIWLAVGE